MIAGGRNRVFAPVGHKSCAWSVEAILIVKKFWLQYVCSVVASQECEIGNEECFGAPTDCPRGTVTYCTCLNMQLYSGIFVRVQNLGWSYNSAQ